VLSDETLGCVVTPCCHDALSAKLIEHAGFSASFVSGFTTSASKGLPDCGLVSYSEMLDQVSSISKALTTMPIIVDGDNGFGNAMNVKRTVRGYREAGVGGVLLEDQLVPKSCGHVKKKQVVSRVDSLSRIKAAVDCRDEEAEEDERLVLIGRTDAKQAIGFEEALWRISAFADLGVDMVFVDALETREEMEIVCKTASDAGVGVLANMLEGGKTPILSLNELDEVGFKLVSYPLSLLGVSIVAMQRALSGLKEGVIPEDIPEFSSLKKDLGFDSYFDELEEYEAFSESFLRDRESK